MQEEANQFLVQLEKLITSEVATTHWAVNMDILAITTFDNLLELYRINYKAQKVFQIEESKPIRSVAFTPDCKLIAYGLVDGSIRVLKTENGERVVIVQGVQNSEIENLIFLNYYSLEPELFLPFQKNAIESKLILNISPHKNCNKNAIIKINYFREMKKDYTLLLSSERQKTTLLINGFIPIGEIQYKQAGFLNPKVLHSYYDKKIMSIVSEQKSDKSCLYLVQFDGGILNIMQEELIKYNCLIAYINEILTFVEVAYDAGEALLRDIIRQYNAKMNLIDDSNIQNINPCEQLFKFLNCGITSTALINFFTKEVHDSKILQKLDEAVNSIFMQLHDLLLQSIQNSLEKATLLLKKLINFSSIKKFNIFGLAPNQLFKIEQKISRLYTMGEILLVESTEAKFDIRNLLVWLNKATIKASGENQTQIENTKSYLNKYTVDFNRLHGFISDENKFKLHNLLNFFSKTNQSFPMIIKTPEFKLFTNSKQSKNPECENFKKMCKLFEVEDIPDPCQKQSMNIQYSFKSFKLEIKELTLEWKALICKPFENSSSLISNNPSKYQIGVIQLNQIFQFEIKAIVKNQELFLYYVERDQMKDRLVEFNCHQRKKNFLTSTKAHILSIAVAEGIIVILQDKLTTKKIIVQVVNEQFNGKEIQIGKTMTKAEGELDINSSMRGLNSLVIDKNKLIIFD